MLFEDDRWERKSKLNLTNFILFAQRFVELSVNPINHYEDV